MKKFATILILLVLTTFTLFKADAYVDPQVQEARAQALVRIGMLKGYEDGSLRLENNITRSEFFTLIVRALGWENEDTSDINVSFSDIDSSHWAYNNVKVAVKLGLVKGYPDNTIAPDNQITYAEVLTVLIRILGYEDTLEGEWPENVVSKSQSLDMVKDLELLPRQQVTRGEVSVLIYNSLTVDFNR